MTSRREKIEAMLQEEPGDVFLRYSLAMELSKEGDVQCGLRKLTELMDEQPPYVPAFFMAGQKYAETGQIEEARRALREGIERARQQGDMHAAGEMSELLASLGTV